MTDPPDGQRDTEDRCEFLLTGVEMYQAVRARLRALVCKGRATRRDAGMVTSEYAMGIVAAVAFSVEDVKPVLVHGVRSHLHFTTPAMPFPASWSAFPQKMAGEGMEIRKHAVRGFPGGMAEPAFEKNGRDAGAAGGFDVGMMIAHHPGIGGGVAGALHGHLQGKGRRLEFRGVAAAELDGKQ